MKRLLPLFAVLFLTSMLPLDSLRGFADPVGYANKSSQMDSCLSRIEKNFGSTISDIYKAWNVPKDMAWRLSICPHDDYTYSGYMYPLALRNIKAKTVIIFGVAHKAKNLNLENQLIFDSYSQWNGPYKPVKVSALREDIMGALPKDLYQVNDSMQKIEHSVEGIANFLQYYNRDVEIVSILVPFMSYQRMDELAQPLAKALAKTMKGKKLEWGKDVALVLSNDAVHYGDQKWGGKNYAFYGTDTNAYTLAVKYENQIISDCFAGTLSTDKIKKFAAYTVKDDNYKEYKWTWCGRYSVPMGLLTAHYLSTELNAKPLQGTFRHYSNSIDHKQVFVKDLGMDATAPASLRHWVGYASIGYE